MLDYERILAHHTISLSNLISHIDVGVNLTLLIGKYVFLALWFVRSSISNVILHGDCASFIAVSVRKWRTSRSYPRVVTSPVHPVSMHKPSLLRFLVPP